MTAYENWTEKKLLGEIKKAGGKKAVDVFVAKRDSLRTNPPTAENF